MFNLASFGTTISILWMLSFQFKCVNSFDSTVTKNKLENDDIDNINKSKLHEFRQKNEQF